MALDSGDDARVARTALMCAARRANLIRCGRSLVVCGKADLTDAEGQTALDIARTANKSKIAALLA